MSEIITILTQCLYTSHILAVPLLDVTLGSFSDYQPSTYSGRAISNLNCPLNSTYSGDCDYVIELFNGCGFSGGDAVLTCYYGKL